MKPINYNQHRSNRSFNSRVRFLILHYTAGNFSSSINALTGPNVSAHYLVPDITDPSYLKAGYTEQEVFNLVDETQRAWHAGVSLFEGREGCNDFSLGIELEGTDDLPFTDTQYQALTALTLQLQGAFAAISTERIQGHSDIAPGRKTDPGPAFDWTRYRAALAQGEGQ